MPIITNFGDVVTVGNAAVNGTGTSSFAGPVTFAQGVSITGAVSTSSAFYGVLAGANTAAVSALTASTNVYAPIVTTPVSNAATAIATTGFYGALVGQNVASVTVLTASGNVNAPTVNVTSLNVSTQANVTFLNVSSSAFLSNANVLTANILSANVTTGNVTTLNVSGLATLFQSNLATANITSLNVSTQANVTFLNVSSSAFLSNANVLTANILSANVTTGNVTTLNVSGLATLFQANIITANLTSLNVSTQANVTFLNVSSTAYLSSANIITGNIATANIASLNVTGDANVANVTVRSNLYASNIIMSSNLSTNTGYGNVYLTGNLVVQGNIFSLGGSVGSGSGTSQGILYSLASPYSLGAAFTTGSAGPGIAGYHINLSPAYFNPEATQSVSAFSAGTGMLKFATGGLYQVTCVVVGDQPIVKLAFGKTSSSSFAALPTGSTAATSGYDYVYNFPVGSSPSTVITIPLTVQDTSQYYYLDAFFSTAAGTPSTLYPTRSTTAVGSAYGTYVQVGPFGNYLTSATGVASGLLMNAYGTTTLSAPVTSNTFRLAMTSSNGWTVNGVSTALTVTSGGNFQASQVGIYEVSMCLNTSVTPMMFGVGSLAADAAPLAQGPYIYQYAPMYTQDPTTVVTMPLNITDTSKYYYLDVIFPGTQSTVALSNVSTFVSLKPVGSYVSPSTNPWSQQGSSVYYTGGAVGIGGVNPSLLTETFTVNGNTAFVGNVTVTSDASSNNYVLARRTPAGSLDVTQYVTGSVPLTTTTNLIQNYLSNAAQITSNTGTGSITQALRLPGTTNSFVNFPSGGVSPALANLATSNLFIEAWINPATSPQGGIICRANGTGPSNQDFRFFIASGGVLTFTVVNSGGSQFTASNATALVAGTWYHVVACYQATSLITGTVRVFTNGGIGGTTGSLTTTQPRLTAGTNIYIGTDVLSGGSGSGTISGNVADVRIFSGSLIVPTATFASPASAPFTQSAPSYVTNMGLVGTANTVLALQSQYFPGASTSPYGPVLTLPGTVGSYYTQASTADNTVFSSNGFTFEYWVNYASFANAGTPQIGKFNPITAGFSWRFDSNVNAGVTFTYYNGGFVSAWGGSTQLVTGIWNHCAVQSNGTNIYIFINGVLVSTTAVSGTPSTPNAPITIGQQNNTTGVNFAIAKARLVYGNDTSAGSKAAANVYSTGNFTANPNFAPVPAGATVAWQLESQYPLPTYPSFFDVPVLSAQTPAYGAEPVPVGGVTSNTLSPFSTTAPQLDSLRFDGTGYIDYGNAASSALTSNIWASPWTIEGWVYPTTVTGVQVIWARSTTSYSTTDFGFYLNGTSPGAQIGPTPSYVSGVSAFAVNTWYHVAWTYDGSNSNIYVNGSLNVSQPLSGVILSYAPTGGIQIGNWLPANQPFRGNLADLRVSNVARYTGSSYTVPTEPHPTNNANTLLLLRSLGGQVGTTLEVQGRGLNSVSLGAGRVVQSYPPAPMSSYLLDTTSNASVTYGQGKYVASASTEWIGGPAWRGFNKTTGDEWACVTSAGLYATTSPYGYLGAVTTVDAIGNSYPGEWLQIQMPVSVIITSYQVAPSYSAPAVPNESPAKFWILGSRDGINWTLVDSRSGISGWVVNTYQNFVVSATQAYSYFRFVTNQTTGSDAVQVVAIGDWTLNGTEESLCVTSDSKVGVGIANPQRALEVAGDLVVSGTISGGAGLGSFRNRVINGDMRIAQRGTSIAITADGGYNSLYFIDRCSLGYRVTTGAITCYQNTLTTSDTPYQYGFRYAANLVVLSTCSNYQYIQPGTIFEGYSIQDFNWGTSFGVPVTLSLWFRSNMPAGSTSHIALRNGNISTSYCVPFTTTGTWQYLTFTIPPPPNGTSFNTGSSGALELVFSPLGLTQSSTGWYASTSLGYNGSYNWVQNAGTFIQYTGVQLEKGTVATPFEQRSFATELTLCQRYYYQWSSAISNGYGSFGFGVQNGFNQVHFIVQYPVTMRSNLTSTSSFSSSAMATFQFNSGGGTPGTLNSITADPGVTTPYTGRFWITTGSAGTAGLAIELRAAGSTSAFLGFSAEL